MFGGQNGINPNEMNNLVIASKAFNSQMLAIEKAIQFLLKEKILPHLSMEMTVELIEKRVAKRLKLVLFLPVMDDTSRELALIFYFDAQTHLNPSQGQATYFYEKILNRLEKERQSFQQSLQRV